MIKYYGNFQNINDLYLRNCFYWASKSNNFDVKAYQIEAESRKLPKTNAKKYVLVITGNETHDCLDDYYEEDARIIAIVKNYPAMANVSNKPGIEYSYQMKTVGNVPRFVTKPEDPRTLNVPLGIANDFPTYWNTRPELKIGFIGQWTKIREYYVNRITEYFKDNLEDIDKSQFLFYKGFGPFVQGAKDGSLTTEDYSANLANYNFSLCISGQSPETYRIFESAASGCAIVSTPLPDTWYYKHLPALYISPQMDFEGYLLKAINDTSLIQKHRDATQIWYHNYAAPKAVGKKIAEHLENFT